eukprot:SAG31_NODE_66_length_28567_cov_30.222698_3_plen_57_part_00
MGIACIRAVDVNLGVDEAPRRWDRGVLSAELKISYICFVSELQISEIFIRCQECQC